MRRDQFIQNLFYFQSVLTFCNLSRADARDLCDPILEVGDRGEALCVLEAAGGRSEGDDAELGVVVHGGAGEEGAAGIAVAHALTN